MKLNAPCDEGSKVLADRYSIYKSPIELLCTSRLTNSLCADQEQLKISTSIHCTTGMLFILTTADTDSDGCTHLGLFKNCRLATGQSWDKSTKKDAAA